MPPTDAARGSVLVIGGGVVGLMSAYALARSGVSVAVCDAGAFSQESSWSGGGILSPVPPWKYGDWVEQMVAHSRVLLDQWVPHLESLSGVSCEYRKTGLLLSGDPTQVDFVGSGKHWLATP
ncbi:MAG TPA: FAD-dependent oxidoreductase, partial [Wenzhouxiangella sp.]